VVKLPKKKKRGLRSSWTFCNEPSERNRINPLP
jgi:hypothetical protein